MFSNCLQNKVIGIFVSPLYGAPRAVHRMYMRLPRRSLTATAILVSKASRPFPILYIAVHAACACR